MRMKRLLSTAPFQLLLGLGVSVVAATSAGCATTAGQTRSAEEDCAGVPAKEQEQGLLAYREDIESARPLVKGIQVGKINTTAVRGTVVTLRSDKNLSAPWLRRVSACHMDLVAAGRIPNASGSDPFAIPGTTVEITEGEMGYLASVEANNNETATEIVQRVAALTAGSAPMASRGVAH